MRKHAITAEQRDPLTTDQKNFLETHGYLTLESVAGADDVRRIRGLLEPLFAAKAGYREGAQFDLIGNDEPAAQPKFPQIINPHHYADELLRTDYFRTASGIARQLLGPKARFVDDHVLMKPALTGPPTPWHQDEAFRNPRYEYREVSIWLALQAVDRRNGCMEFIPGSNRGDILPHRSPNGAPNVHALACYEGFDPAAAVPCPLPAGGCTVHTGRTLHFAGPNVSDLPRYAYVLIFNLPPVPARQPREFPWLAHRQTLHDQRTHIWRWRGGIAVETLRWIRKLNLRDLERLSYDISRAKNAAARTLRGRQ